MNDVYGKAMASIEGVDDDKFGPNGGFTAVLSTPSLDRDGDRLHRNEWVEPLLDRYPLDIDHGMSVADTVGSFRPYFENDRLMMDAYFASTPRAQEVRTLVNEGHIGNVSVAFMTDKSKKDGEPRRELLNAGIVGVPSNRDAVILASKAAEALREALSDATEGDVPEEVTKAVLEALSPNAHICTDGGCCAEKSADEADTKALEALKNAIADIWVKAGATASGIGGDGALVQAIHDASSHLGAACPVIEVTDEDDGASSGANKSIVFGDKSGQSIAFASHDEAREFFKDMLESIDSAEAREETLVEVRQDGEPSKQEAFEKALDQVLTSQDEPPAEAAAATDEVPAPAVEAAGEDDAVIRARAMRMGLALFNPTYEKEITE